MSDQDFFFDEEDEKPAKSAAKSSPKAGSAPKTSSAKKAAPAPDASGSFFEQSVTMSVASLLVVCGLLVGLIGGVLIGQARATSVANIPAIDQTGAPGGGTAPQLTPDQMNSGQLPPGHPSVGGGAAGGATGTAQPSQPATGK